jgi:hypothetical protein
MKKDYSKQEATVYSGGVALAFSAETIIERRENTVQ